MEKSMWKMHENHMENSIWRHNSEHMENVVLTMRRIAYGDMITSMCRIP